MDESTDIGTVDFALTTENEGKKRVNLPYRPYSQGINPSQEDQKIANPVPWILFMRVALAANTYFILEEKHPWLAMCMVTFSVEELGTISKNNLRGATTEIRLIWGIESDTLHTLLAVQSTSVNETLVCNLLAFRLHL